MFLEIAGRAIPNIVLQVTDAFADAKGLTYACRCISLFNQTSIHLHSVNLPFPIFTPGGEVASSNQRTAATFPVSFLIILIILIL